MSQIGTPLISIEKFVTDDRTGAAILDDMGIDEPTEEEMDAAKALLGDGAARVTREVPLKFWGEGVSYGAVVTVALTCDQSLATIQRADELAYTIALERTTRTLAEIEEIAFKHHASSRVRRKF